MEGRHLDSDPPLPSHSSAGASLLGHREPPCWGEALLGWLPHGVATVCSGPEGWPLFSDWTAPGPPCGLGCFQQEENKAGLDWPCVNPEGSAWGAPSPV